MSDMIYDYLIIGAGPSGLTFTKTLSTIIPKPTFIIFDMGNDINERDKYDKKDSAIGTGGAGLFSDGKFSFYPSGTHVYELNLIRKAYEILSSDLLHFDITLEDFPSITTTGIWQRSNSATTDLPVSRREVSTDFSLVPPLDGEFLRNHGLT